MQFEVNYIWFCTKYKYKKKYYKAHHTDYPGALTSKREVA